MSRPEILRYVLSQITTAEKLGIPLEINEHSIHRKQFRKEFWDLVPEEIIRNAKKGYDAHCIENMVYIFQNGEVIFNEYRYK